MLRRCLLLLLLAAGTPVSADQLYVRNRPYAGYTTGKLSAPESLEVDVAEMAGALDLPYSEVDGNWVVGNPGAEGNVASNAGLLIVQGTPLPYRFDNGRRLVQLGALSQAVGALLKRDSALGTVDLSLTGRDVNSGNLIGPNQLLYFGADWAPASKMFKPNVLEIDKRGLLPVIYIDCTRPRSANYRNFIRYFQGNMIPYTVLLGPGRKVVKSWTGYQEMGAWATELQGLLNSSAKKR